MTRETTLLDAPGVVKELHTEEPPSAELALRTDVGMFERLARDPNVPVDKLERLIALQERVMAHNAEQAFWEAFGQMQGDLPTITEDGAIAVDGSVRSRYSTNENIQECIRPILQKHGFALSFRHTTKDGGLITVTGILAHRGGHKETDTFETKPDDGGKMNTIQRIGSARSYGQRYTTIALCNIVSRAPGDSDDDGQKSERPTPPNGYAAWVATLDAVASDGQRAFDEAWQKSKAEFKTFCVNHDRAEYSNLKAKAAKRR